MHGAYIGALETRLGWLRWTESKEAQKIYSDKTLENFHGIDDWAVWSPLMMAKHVLLHGDTFFMDRRFCQLVDHARQSIPGETAYDPAWLISKDGWLWIDEPVQVPDLLETDKLITPDYTTVRAVGWRHVPAGTTVYISKEKQHIAPDGTTHFLFFIALHDYATVMLNNSRPVGTSAATAKNGFGIWSYFTLKPGDTVNERIIRFESSMREKDPDGQYVDEVGRRMNLLHEIRWLFTALKLMSQRLTSQIRIPTARHVWRRAERENQVAPPYIDVITLRRLHHEAIRSGEAQTKDAIDWSCQWVVGGHWRQQWYPSKGTHLPKFIDAYIKGPDDKPLKESGIKLFTARR